MFENSFVWMGFSLLKVVQPNKKKIFCRYSANKTDMLQKLILFIYLFIYLARERQIDVQMFMKECS